MKTLLDSMNPKIFLTNVGALYAGTLVRMVISLFTIGLISRYLTLGEFGIYAMVSAYCIIFKAVSRMGLQPIIVREVSRQPSRADGYFASGLLIVSFLLAISYLAMVATFFLFVSSSDVLIFALIMSLGELLESVGNYFNAFFRAFERMKYVAYQLFVRESLNLIFVVAVVKVNLGLNGIGLALLSANVIGGVFGYYWVRRFVSLTLKGNVSQWKYLIKESYPLGIKIIFRKITFRLDTILLGVLKTKSLAGLFHGPYRIIQKLMFLSEDFTSALFPILSRHAATSREGLEIVYEKSFKFVAVVAFMFGITFSLFSRTIILVVLGQKFLEAVPVLQIMGWVLTLMFMVRLMEKMLIALRQQRITTFAAATALSLNIVLDLTLIPPYGLKGAAIATLFAEVTMFSMCLYFVCQYVRANILSILGKPLVAAGIAWAFHVSFQKENTVFMAVCLIIYIVVLFIQGVFKKDEIWIVKDIFSQKLSRIYKRGPLGSLDEA